jgi:hypothetical protein
MEIPDDAGRDCISSFVSRLCMAQLVSQTNLDNTKWTAVNGGWIDAPNGDLYAICQAMFQSLGEYSPLQPYVSRQASSLVAVVWITAQRPVTLRVQPFLQLHLTSNTGPFRQESNQQVMVFIRVCGG